MPERPPRGSEPVSAESRAPRLGSALRSSLAEGYRGRDLLRDVGAGAVVALVAVPLSMALAIASGVPPHHGLITAVVAGFVIALLGGSRVQVSGPTAAFVVILAPIAQGLGIGGLLVATLAAGMILIALGLMRMGRLIQFVPYPVTIGFTAGIGFVIATLQLNDLLGLRLSLPDHFVDKVVVLVEHAAEWRPQELLLGLGTVALLVLWPKIDRRVPAPLIALGLATLAGLAIGHWRPEYAVDTIGSRFGGIPAELPAFAWPWLQPGPEGAALVFDRATSLALLQAGFAIAMLGAIESLLSAVVADGMTGKRHDPDGELVAQGLGNVLVPFFGGIAATGALARTATNVRYGARTPVAAMVHAVLVLAAMVVLASLLERLPMAALSGLLLVVAWNMSEARHLPRVLRQGPRADAVVLVTVFLLTVVFDMVVGVSAGLVLASLLFMRRMSEVSGARVLTSAHPEAAVDLPPGVLHYEVTGPLFFGAVHKATGLLERTGQAGGIVLLDLRAVPSIDATALVNLKGALERVLGQGARVVVAGLQPQPALALARAGILAREGRLTVERSFEVGLAAARAWATARY